MSKKQPVKRKKRQESYIFKIEDDLCVWMTARVVNFKLCDHMYDCSTCSFDRAMREAWGQVSGEETGDGRKVSSCIKQ